MRTDTKQEREILAVQFGKLLKKERLRKGVGTPAVGKILGVSGPYIHWVEAGKRPPLTEQNICKVSEYFGIDPLPLLEAGAAYRGYVSFEKNQPEAGETFLYKLARYGKMTDTLASQLLKVLEKHEPLKDQEHFSFNEQEKVAA
jgi:transcriptional regulator with XRE-family HTH domain